MNDFLRSMKGEAGPRTARGAIKRLRSWKFRLALGWLALCALAYLLLGKDVILAHLGAGVIAVLPLLPGIVAANCCETQIRHFNDLALSPFETGRMDRAGAKRMWIGNALILLGVLLFFYGAAASIGHIGAGLGILWGASGAMLVAGYVLSSYKTGLGWIVTPRYGPTYDPDEDEWNGFGGWGR